MTWSHLERGSSPVDWCEQNYSISPVIAEFVNTISNILFLLLPPILIHLFKEYAEFVNPAIHILWILLMVVGMSSAYFHATLSLLGQLLDELAILWVFMAAFTLFLPKRVFPKFCKNDRRIVAVVALLISIGSTGFLLMYPAANAFALMILALPAFVVLVVEVQRVKCARVYNMGVRCATVWVLAIVCWVFDRLFCDIWSSINFPYLHGLWHILVFIAGYTALVLFSYVTVNEEQPEKFPVLKYWPQNDFELGVPYVTIKSHKGDEKAHI